MLSLSTGTLPVLPGTQKHKTACHLLNSAQSTEIVREWSTQEERSKLLQYKKKRDEITLN